MKIFNLIPMKSFIALVTIGNYILLNLLIAILVDSFSNDVQFSFDDFKTKKNRLSNRSKSISLSVEIQTELFNHHDNNEIGISKSDFSKLNNVNGEILKKSLCRKNLNVSKETINESKQEKTSMVSYHSKILRYIL